MSIFIWENVSHGLTPNYHSGGACAVIAASAFRAAELLRATPGVSNDSDVFEKAPDFVTDVACKDEKVFIFPDAGCC